MANRKRPYSDANMQSIDSDRLNQRQVTLLEQDVLKIIDDYSVAGVEYFCWAECGADINSPVWKIQRITTVGNIETAEWADGDGKFDNIAANRAVLTYK